MGFLSNYCGLGGSGLPQHEIDDLCRIHDEAYTKMIHEGKNPYLYYNEADKEFIERLRKIGPRHIGHHAIKKIALGYFSFKEKVAPNMEKHISRKLKRKEREHDEEHQRHLRGPSQYNLLEGTEATTSTAMAHHGGMETHEQRNMGGAPEEGGETQVTPYQHVWRRFPNTETTALKWVWTQFLNDAATPASGSYPPNVPFDETGTKTATNLISGGGGAFSQTTASNIFGSTYTGNSAQLASGHDFTNPVLLQLRMTSPYNIVKQLAGTNESTITSYAQPTWLEYFDSKYQYYHTLECEWEISFYFGQPWYFNSTTPADIADSYMGFYIFWKYTNQDDPPTSYSLSTSNIANINNSIGPNTNATGTQITSVTALTGSGGTVNCTPDDYFRMDGWKHKHIMLNTIRITKISIEGKYHYGQCKMDVKSLLPTDAHGSEAIPTAEGWQLTGQTSAFPENLSVIIVQDNAMCAQPGIFTPCSIRCETEHLTQFKDLRSGYKFPTPANGIINSSTTLNTDAGFFMRGAAYT